MRVFWDTMIFIYLLEGRDEFRLRAQQLLQRSLKEGDVLCTSYLALGEVLAGAGQEQRREIEAGLDVLGFVGLPFDGTCVRPFAFARAHGVKAPDAIHLACASSFGVDVFLTADRKLHTIEMPGIGCMTGFDQGQL